MRVSFKFKKYVGFKEFQTFHIDVSSLVLTRKDRYLNLKCFFISTNELSQMRQIYLIFFQAFSKKAFS